MISISIVSHGQFALIKNLLDNLQQHCAESVIEIILTFNIPEAEDKLNFNFDQYRFPVKIITNSIPQGFGQNHNQAFKHARYGYFCVLNPDIILLNNPFLILINTLKNHLQLGVVSPTVINKNHHIQDNARKFLTVSGLIARIIKKIFSRNTLEYPEEQFSQDLFYPDWIAGMFMLFPSRIYQDIQGFDEKYFLYCEDMDICLNLTRKKYKIGLVPEVKVIHLTQHDSHKKIRYFIWHIQSLMRFFLKKAEII